MEMTGVQLNSNTAEITPLSKDPQTPCILLDFQQMPFLLDCALQMLWTSSGSSAVDNKRAGLFESILRTTSEIRFAVPPITPVAPVLETVLISNPYNMLALPYLTEYTQFSGTVYATDPTVEFGRYVRGGQRKEAGRERYESLTGRCVLSCEQIAHGGSSA
ncbi:Integrator complex subunit 9 [Geranomyces michiganensis]|nr:Integrator complex subunit 9 [Geranomyces michiganensis]